MAKISIDEIDLSTFHVGVVDQITTNHVVTVKVNYALSLTASKITTKQLVYNAFEFLLAREPNTSILRNFDLKVIPGYFPEFDQTMRQLVP